MKGCWLYGDYINGLAGVSDPVSCANACELDENCYHWNFQAGQPVIATNTQI